MNLIAQFVSLTLVLYYTSATPITPFSSNGCIGTCNIVGDYIPHEDRTYFCQCEPQGAKPIQCRPGTVWDQLVLTCVHDVSPSTTAAPISTTTQPSPPPTTAAPTSTTTPQPLSTTTAPTSTTTQIPITTGSPNPCIGSCQEPNNGFLPHVNVHYFCRCVHNQAVPMQCAPGTVWDQSLLTCDHDYFTTTQAPTSTTGYPSTTTLLSTTTSELPSTTTGYPSTTTFRPTTDSPSGCIGSCSDSNKGYLPHENAEYFCQCVDNVDATVFHCPEGTKWDQTIIVCVHEYVTTTPDWSTTSTEWSTTSGPTTEWSTTSTEWSTTSGPTTEWSTTSTEWSTTSRPTTDWSTTPWPTTDWSTTSRPTTDWSTTSRPTTPGSTDSTPAFPSTTPVAQNGCIGSCTDDVGYIPHEDRSYFCQCEPTGPRPISCRPGTIWSQIDLTCVHDDEVLNKY